MNITIPEPLRPFVESQVASGEFANPDDYIATLVRAEYRKQFEDEVVRGWEQLERGEGVEMTDKDWEQMQNDYKKRHNLSS